MRISDWSSDVCSSDLAVDGFRPARPAVHRKADLGELARAAGAEVAETEHADRPALRCRRDDLVPRAAPHGVFALVPAAVEAPHLQQNILPPAPGAVGAAGADDGNVARQPRSNSAEGR